MLFFNMESLPAWLRAQLAARGVDLTAIKQALLDANDQWLLFETPQAIHPADGNSTSDIYRLDLLTARLALLSRTRTRCRRQRPQPLPRRPRPAGDGWSSGAMRQPGPG